MSKGRRRNTWKALANRKRNPESWFPGPVVVKKAGKNKVWTKLPKGERGRDA